MTVAIVLKPDFTTTFSRGVLRLAGTFAGLALATALFHWLSPSAMVQAVSIGIFMFLMRWAGPANYGVLVTALTALVVLLFAITGVAPAELIGREPVHGDRRNHRAGRLPHMAHLGTHAGARALARLLDAYRAHFPGGADAYLLPAWKAIRYSRARSPPWWRSRPPRWP